MAIVIWYNMAMQDIFLLSLLRWVDLGVVFKLILLILFLFLIHLLIQVYTSQIHANYENDLNELQNLVGETVEEKINWQLDYIQVKKEFNAMKAKFSDKNIHSNALQHRLHQLEGQVTILASDLSRAVTERDRLGRELSELETESKRLQAELADLLPQWHCLDEQAVARIFAEDQLKATTEEFNLKCQLYHDEILEIRSRHQVDLKELNDRLQQEFEQKLQQRDLEARAEYEARLRRTKEELEISSKLKAAEMKSKLNLANLTLSAQQEELSSVNLRLECALKAYNRLKRECQIREERARRESSTDTDAEGEDYIPFDSNSIVNGDVEILEDVPTSSGVCSFIRLRNNGEKEVALSRWTLTREAGDSITTHTFHRTMKLKSKEIVTVWSSDGKGARHKPPTSIVMKGQKWPAAERIITTLSNSEEEMARWETQVCRL